MTTPAPKRLRAALVLISLSLIGLASLWKVAPLFDQAGKEERAAVDACEGAVRRALGSEVMRIDTVDATEEDGTWTVHLHLGPDHDWTCEARRGPAGRWFATATP